MTDKEQKWITVNGKHVPVNPDGSVSLPSKKTLSKSDKLSVKGKDEKKPKKAKKSTSKTTTTSDKSNSKYKEWTGEKKEYKGNPKYKAWTGTKKEYTTKYKAKKK